MNNVEINKTAIGLAEFISIVKNYDSYFEPQLSQSHDIDEWCKKIFTNGQIDHYVCVDNSFAGLAAYYCNDTTTYEGYLSLIFIDSHYQRRGYSSVIFDNMLAFCKDNGMKCLKLECNKNNMAATMFYLKKKGEVYYENERSFFYSFAL